MRKILTALAVLALCLSSAAAVDAAPTRKAHARAHHTAGANISPSQAFAQLAARRPDRRVRRHPSAWLSRARTSPHSADDEAAIQNDVSADAVADNRPSPVLEPLGILIAVQAPLESHDSFARRSPRAPPACS